MGSTEDVELLRKALRLTREYLGERTLPALPGWDWYDAVKATGGLGGFGRCGCALDLETVGRNEMTTGLLYCELPAGHVELPVGDPGRDHDLTPG